MREIESESDAHEALQSIKKARWYTEMCQSKVLRKIADFQGLRHGDVVIVTYARRIVGGAAKKVVWFDRLATTERTDGYTYVFRMMSKSMNRTNRLIRLPNILDIERIARLGPMASGAHEIGQPSPPAGSSAEHNPPSDWKSQLAYRSAELS